MLSTLEYRGAPMLYRMVSNGTFGWYTTVQEKDDGHDDGVTGVLSRAGEHSINDVMYENANDRARQHV